MTFWSETKYEEELKLPSPPRLTRDACLSQKGVRSFLKLSRLASDDTIKQHLNNILDSHLDSVKKDSDKDVCNLFIDSYLKAHWRSRLDTIEYCSKEAENLKKEIDASAVSLEKKEVDPRIDPYYERSFQDRSAQDYSLYTQLHSWIQNELEIESIVRERSINILKDRCQIDRDLRAEID